MQSEKCKIIENAKRMANSKCKVQSANFQVFLLLYFELCNFHFAICNALMMMFIDLESWRES